MRCGYMNNSIICILNMRETEIPFGRVRLVENKERLDEGTIDRFSLTIRMWMQCSGEVKLCTQKFPQGPPKVTNKSRIPIRDNARWDAIMIPHMIKEELG